MSETIKTGLLKRDFIFRKDQIDEKARTVPLSFSSEDPYDRWFGTEILGHDEGEVDLSFIGSGHAPLLLQHFHSDQIGVIDSAEVGTDRKGRAVARFSKSRHADEIFEDVKEGIRTNISVGYHIKEMILVEENEKEGRIYRATRWKPLEVSVVAVPADEKVGVSREKRDKEPNLITKIITREAAETEPQREEETVMSETQNTATQTAEPPVVDVAKIQKEARAHESARVRDIIALGEAHDMRDDAHRFVNDDKSLDQFRGFVLDKLRERGLTPVETGGDIGLSKKETQQFSFLRAFNAMANRNDPAAQDAAGFELECSRAVADRMRRSPQGIFVPPEVLRRDLTAGTDDAGGYLVSTDLLSANFIEMLRNRMMCRQLGATVLGGLVGDVAIPKQAGGATSYWVAESGAPTESQQTLAQLPLTPKTVGAFTDISRKLLIQSSLDVEAFVRDDLSKALAIALDLAGIAGTGADNQPTGILSTTGIGDVAGGTNGLAPAWSHLVDLETEVAVDNADVGALAYLTSAKVRGALKQTEKSANTAQYIWERGNEAGFGEVNGYRAAVSNQVPDTLDKGTSTGVCSAIIYGNWSDLVFAMWGTLDLLADPFTGSTSGTVRVVALQDADIGVRHAESFSAMQDALTA